jgi:uncharacterized protein YdeI (YjbR/CyaY-like superfamily)
LRRELLENAMIVDPKSVRVFASEAAFEAWLSKHHDREKEVWIKIFKKATGQPTVTPAQAIDVALSWGWIDGIRKAFDERAFLQRFTPRGPRSRWSQINRGHVERLVKAKRMRPAGQRHVDAAKADGRWNAAYPSPGNMQVPPDLLAAIHAKPKALATFRSLNRVNVYAIAYRMHHIKTPARREQKLEEIVAMLARGKSFHPNARPARAVAKNTKANAQSKTRAKGNARSRTG